MFRLPNHLSAATARWRPRSLTIAARGAVAFVAMFLAVLLAPENNFAASADQPATVSLPGARHQSTGIRLTPVVSQPFLQSIQMTGRVTLNEERLAHIYPIVEGLVEAVDVALGDTVQAGDRLVVVHSREVGAAKLDLYQAKLQHETATLNLRLQEELVSNTRQLLEALRKQEDIRQIQRRFTGQSMGDYRERLLQAYASALKSEADVQRLGSIVDSGAVSAKQLYAAEANRNADQATFEARIEQIEFELKMAMLKAQQAVREVETRIAVCTTNLQILGCERSEIDSIDPVRQGEAVSDYVIRAPFAGTIISKDVVLKEQARPDSQIMAIADLSTVWIEANVYEKDVPYLSSLANQTLEIRNDAWPDRVFTARVFSSGEIMNETSRTIPLRAVADNAQRMLKPGMFITVSFRAGDPQQSVLQVPTSAVQEHAGQRFVFVPDGPDAFQRRDVVTGPQSGQMTVIQSGLTTQDQVVSSGGFVLKSLLLESLLGED